MNSVKAYEEVVNFIAAGTTSQNVAAFKASEETRERVGDLIFREKTEGISAEEKAELDLYLQVEHLMRLAKAKARSYLK
jgi:hypothetical protein